VLALLGASTTVPAQSAGAAIDVLVLYTPKVEQEFRQRHNTDIGDEIFLVETLQNRIFENSGVRATVRLAAAPLKFDEDKDIPGRFSADCERAGRLQAKLLCHFAESAGAPEDRFEIAKQRKAHKADLVSVWMWLGGWYTDGSNAQLLTKTLYNGGKGAKESAGEAYMTLILAEKAWLWWHFAHELGHNLGLADDGDDEERLIRTDAYGYVDAEYPFRTIMRSKNECVRKQFPDCPRIPVYSTADPKVTFFGRAVGRTGRADEVQTLHLTTPFVATYDSFLK